MPCPCKDIQKNCCTYKGLQKGCWGVGGGGQEWEGKGCAESKKGKGEWIGQRGGGAGAVQGLVVSGSTRLEAP